MKLWMKTNLKHQLKFLEEELIAKAANALRGGESEVEVLVAIQNHLIQWISIHGSEVSLDSTSRKILKMAKENHESQE